VGHGPAHLPAELGADDVGPLDHPRHEPLDHGHALGEGRGPPRPLRRHRPAQKLVDGGGTGDLGSATTDPSIGLTVRCTRGDVIY
jgi:hypothetical protein